MNIQDLIRLYEEKRKIYGADTYQHISDLLSEAKKIHLRIGQSIQPQAVTMNSLGELSKGKTTKNSCYT